MKTLRKTSSGSVFLLFVVMLISSGGQDLFAQGVGISDVSITPDASSILELRSTVRGLLTPRMTTPQRIAIAAPATGLLVYDLSTRSYWYYDTGWKAVMGSGSIGGPDQLLGMDAAGSINEYKTLIEGTNILITHSIGGITFSTVNSPVFDNLTLTNPLTVPNGGTGITSGTSGGIPYYNSSTTMASSALMTANGVVVGGGTGIAPFTIPVGAPNTILRGTGGTPVFGQVVNGDIATGAVTTAEILDETILAGDISTGAVTTAEILDETILAEDISTGAVTTSEILDETVSTNDILNESILAADIATGAVTTSEILNGTIADEDLNKPNIPLSGFGAAAASVNLGNQLIINLLDPVNPQDGATKNYVDNAVDGDNDLAEGNIWVGDASGNQIAVDASGAGFMLVGNGTTVTSVDITGDIDVSTLGDAQIQAGAVTTTEILDETVATGDILNETILAEDIATGAVTTAEILDETILAGDISTGAVTTSEILDETVSTNDILNESILAADIATGAVTTNEILNGTIADEDLNKPNIPLSGFGAAAASVDLGNQLIINLLDPVNPQDGATKNYVDNAVDGDNDLAEGNIWVGDASGNQSAVDASGSGFMLVGNGITVTSVDITGDIDVSTLGDAQIQAGVVTTTEILDETVATGDILNETILAEDIATGAVTTAEILNETILAEDIATGAVTTQEILDETILAGDISTGAVTTAEILDETILAEDIAIGAVTTSEILNETILNEDIADATISLIEKVTGILPIANGGTNSGTALVNGRVMVSRGDQIVEAGVMNNGQVIVGSTGLEPQIVSMAGDLTINNTGVATITPDAVSSAEIAPNTIVADDIAQGGVGSDEIADLSIVNADVNAAAAIDASKLAGGLVDNTEFSYVNGVLAPIQGQFTALQGELDNTQDGAGLDADGDYVVDGTSTYLTAATSLSNADQLLDAAITSSVTDITGLQTEVDNIETGAGLDTDGTYIAPTTSNYINGSTSLVSADLLLDTQLKSTDDDLAAEVIRATAAEFTLTTDLANEVIRATAAESTLTTDLSTEVTDRTNADAALQAELNTTQTGAGLTATGAYAANTGTNYIDGATSLNSADLLLDAAIVTSSTALQTEVDAIETGSGLDTDGTYIAPTTSNYINGSTSLVSADLLLDAQLKSTDDDLAAEVIRATAAEFTLTTDLANEVIRATGVETTLTTNLSTEVTDRITGDAASQTYADGKVTDNIADGATTIAPSQNAVFDALALKLDANTAIAGSTRTKITYDSDGLVTAGADATTADIASSSDRRYVTDAQLVVIVNTTNTNSGDISLAGESYLSLAGQALTASDINLASNVTGLLPGANGGTGVNNGTNLITVGGDFTTSPANDVTLTTTGTTNVTLPTSGTLATLSGAETFTNKSISTATNTITGLTNANLSGTAGITNANLANSSITVGTTAISLGTSSTVLAGLTSVTSTDFIGALTGNATTSTTAANLSGGLGGSIPYQSGANATVLLANGNAGQVLTSNGTTLAPSWTTPTTGTVSTVSVVTANGLAGSVSNPGTTPAITLSTTVNGLLKGNGTAISAASSGTDYSEGTSALTTGILKSTTGTGALTIAAAGDFPTLNQNTTGTATNVTGIISIVNGGTGQITQQAAINALSGAVTSGSFLRGDGTNVTLSQIQSGDVPILNQNTTGTASNVTGVVAIVNGGTGSSTQNFVDLTTNQTVAGAKTWSNFGTFNAGITATGGTISLNDNSTTNTTNIGTGTTTGGVTIGNTNNTVSINGIIPGANPLVFDGATPDANRTTFAITDPTASNTITFPNASGTVALVGATSYWSLGGNAGTDDATNFIGTIDNQDIVFKANSNERGRIESSTGDFKFGDATSGTIKATRELIMRQDGGTYGPSILRIKNETGENGAIFETTHATTTLVDFIFKTASNQRNIRFESRGGGVAKTGNPSFHIGGANAGVADPDNPTLSIGDSYSAFSKPLRIGNYTLPSALLHLAAGTASANTAPLKFSSGSLLTTTEAGAIEFYNDNYYATITTGAGTAAARKTIAFLESPSFTTPNIGAATGNSLALSANITADHLIGGTGVPSVAFFSGASGTPTGTSISGTDMGGSISYTTGGTNPSANSLLARITFATPYSSAPSAIIITAGTNQSGLEFDRVYVTNITTTTFDIRTTSTAMAGGAGIAHTFYFMVVQ